MSLFVLYYNMEVNVFIFAHGCYLRTKMPFNPNINIFFDTPMDTCSQGDFTNPSWNTSDYNYEDKNNDYNLSFTDELSELAGFNSLGVYIYNKSNITSRRISEFDNVENINMSNIIQYLLANNIVSKTQRINIYCRICRTPCDKSQVIGGKRYKSKFKKIKKSKKTKRSKKNKTKNIKL